MKFEVKSQERLQAQAEIFGDKGVVNFSEDQAKILKYSAELAKIEDLNNLPPNLPEELVELIHKHKKAYVGSCVRKKSWRLLLLNKISKPMEKSFTP
jgi:hypothetical protein